MVLKPNPIFLQCFDAVGWVKPVPDMTYNVFGGMLNLALSVSFKADCFIVTSCSCVTLF